MKDLAADTPFDQYSRQQTVTALVNSLRSKGQKFKIIDLGGHKGRTKDFLPTDNITVVDVYDEKYPGYVKGDATNLKFKDKSFDVVVSFDVLEHIPRDKRPAFFKEAARVSKLGVFVCCPVDDAKHTVSAAEKKLNKMYKGMYGEDHPWLIEHIDYKIPTAAEIETMIGKRGFAWTSSNPLDNWQIMQTLLFLAAKNPDATDPVMAMGAWYNQHSSELEHDDDVSYRRIYFFSDNADAVATVAKAIESLQANAPNASAVRQTMFDRLVECLATINKNSVATVTKLYDHIHAMDANVADLKKYVADVETTNRQLQASLETIRHSIGWKLSKPLRMANNRRIKHKSKSL